MSKRQSTAIQRVYETRQHAKRLKDLLGEPQQRPNESQSAQDVVAALDAVNTAATPATAAAAAATATTTAATAAASDEKSRKARLKVLRDQRRAQKQELHISRLRDAPLMDTQQSLSWCMKLERTAKLHQQGAHTLFMALFGLCHSSERTSQSLQACLAAFKDEPSLYIAKPDLKLVSVHPPKVGHTDSDTADDDSGGADVGAGALYRHVFQLFHLFDVDDFCTMLYIYEHSINVWYVSLCRSTC